MALPYPITSYSSRFVDLTGGKMDRFENYVIRKVSNVRSFFATYNSLSKLDARELSDIGLDRNEIRLVSLCALKGDCYIKA